MQLRFRKSRKESSREHGGERVSLFVPPVQQVNRSSIWLDSGSSALKRLFAGFALYKNCKKA